MCGIAANNGVSRRWVGFGVLLSSCKQDRQKTKAKIGHMFGLNHSSPVYVQACDMKVDASRLDA